MPRWEMGRERRLQGLRAGAARRYAPAWGDGVRVPRSGARRPRRSFGYASRPYVWPDRDRGSRPGGDPDRRHPAQQGLHRATGGRGRGTLPAVPAPAAVEEIPGRDARARPPAHPARRSSSPTTRSPPTWAGASRISPRIQSHVRLDDATVLALMPWCWPPAAGRANFCAPARSLLGFITCAALPMPMPSARRSRRRARGHHRRRLHRAGSGRDGCASLAWT